MPHHAIDSAPQAMTLDANPVTPHAMPAPRAGSAPAGQLRAFTDAFGRLGYDTTALLAHAGLRAADLNDPDAMVPCAALDAIVNRACEERRTPNLGAHLAAVTPIGAHPLLDYLVVTADTIGAALEQLVRYVHCAQAPFTLSVTHDSDAVRLVVHCGDLPFLAEYETSIAVHHLREETEQRLRVSGVCLTHEPENRADLERLLGCPVRAPSTWNGVEFPPDAMRLPLRRRDPALRAILEGHAVGVLARVSAPEDRSTSASVRTVLVSRLARGVPTMASIARQLAIAPRTLQRRLATEGTSYQQVVDVTRREAAERLLANASVAIGELGYLLGFSEPSAFHRAFKRWHRMTPQDYRTAHRYRQ